MQLENERSFTEINQAIDLMLVHVTRAVRSDELWACFGFKGRPVRTGIWYALRKNKYLFEQRLFTEFVAIGTVDLIRVAQRDGQWLWSGGEKLIVGLVSRLWHLLPKAFVSLPYLLQRIEHLFEVSASKSSNDLRTGMLSALCEPPFTTKRARCIVGLLHAVPEHAFERGTVTDKQWAEHYFASTEANGYPEILTDSDETQLIVNTVESIYYRLNDLDDEEDI